MPNKLGRLHYVLLILWVIPLFGFFWYLSWTKAQTLDANATLEQTNVKVYSNPKWYYEFDRVKAVDFTLDKMSGLLNYLLLAAAGVLGFVVKSILAIQTDQAKAVMDGKPAPPLHSTQLLLFMHTGISCFFSLLCGVLAYLFLPSVGVSDSVNLSGQISACIQCQIIALLIGLFILLMALAILTRSLLP